MTAGTTPLPPGELAFLTAADGTRFRVGVFSPSAPRGTVLLLPGFREFIEKYAEVIQELNQRGLAVAAIDWRAQGLSERPLDNRQKVWVDSFSSYLGDLGQFYDTLVEPVLPKPHFLLGHSMGGHLGLRFVHDRRGAFEKALFSAPMVNIKASNPVLRFLVRLINGIGLGKRYLLGGGDYGKKDVTFKGNVLTNDEQRFFNQVNLIVDQPDLKTGGPTWGWAKAAMRSVEVLADPLYPKAIPIDCLFFLAEQEALVDNSAIRHFVKYMVRPQLIELAEAKHEIMMETDAVRQQFWDQFDAFLDY